MSKFYAYMWMREDGTPYYVGKGQGKRAFQSDKHTVRRPKDRSHILVFERSSEQEAFETEKELIANWGRKDLGIGCLWNLTVGGEGAALSPETCQKISQIKVGHVVAEETRQKIGKAMIGKKNALGHTLSGDSLKKAQDSAKLGGQAVVEKQLGIFSPEFNKTKRTDAVKAFHASLTPEERHDRAVKANEGLTKEQSKENGRLGYLKSGSGRSLHFRWHVNRGLIKPDCKFCEAAL